MPFSPPGRAFLAGAVRDTSELEAQDMRVAMPRFTGDNLDHNLQLVDELAEIASDNACSPAQQALAWVLAQDPDFVPIPGTKHVRFVEENAATLECSISEGDLNRAGELFAGDAVRGARYAPSQAISLDPDE